MSAGAGRAGLPGAAGPTRRWTAANLDRVVRLAALLDRGETGALDVAGRQEAESLAHQVVGSAGTVGHPAASLDAARLERFFAAAGPVHERPREEREHARATLGRLTTELGG